MAESTQKSNEISFSANVLTKREDDMYVAHCLELDIVAVSATVEDVQREIVSLICTQIDYAFKNDNIDHLYNPAPPEIWQEFFKCKEQIERTYAIESGFKEKSVIEKLIPPWLVTKTCNSEPNLCYA